MSSLSSPPRLPGSAAQRGPATRDRLLDAAAEVIAEGGYAAATVAAVAERCGVATGALYRHFPSKAELMVELFRRAADEQLESMQAAAAEAETFVGKLEAVLRDYATTTLDNPRMSWALVYEPVDLAVDLERLACRRRYCEDLAHLLRLAVDAGELPPQDPAMSAAATVGALAEGLAGALTAPPVKGSARRALIENLTRFCRRGVGVVSE